jgi:hypothetical protein
VTGATSISVTEAASADLAGETLEFRDRVCEVSFAHGHLVVTTLSQCLIYPAGQWHSPHTLDLRAPAHLIIQVRGPSACPASPLSSRLALLLPAAAAAACAAGPARLPAS